VPKGCRSLGRPERMAGNPCACTRFAYAGTGHRPCRSAPSPLVPPGAQSPRPAAALPPAGASPRPGRVLASVPPGLASLLGTVPPELMIAPSPLQWQGPSPLPQRYAGIRTGRGPKAPGQRPPCPRRALRPPPGRVLASVPPGFAGLQGTVPRGRGETRVAFPVPAPTGESTAPAPMAGAIVPAKVPGSSLSRR